MQIDTDTRCRCTWAETDPLLRKYHDEEWGVPVHDDRLHFMYLLMESMSCGLSWLLMLKKWDTFRRCFADFDYNRVAAFTEDDIRRVATAENMIHSERKVAAMVSNARAFCRIREEFGTFDKYIWSFTRGKTMVYPSHQHRWCVRNTLSDKIAKDLKRRGFKYVGTVIIYSHLQGIGIINDHQADCFRYDDFRSKATSRMGSFTSVEP
ncbi:MAG: DNA-3-methyladenine glycosylase I [Prevotella sp.]|nr:DNA-3-methyladenine glycosylase I [Prevotella sp.]